MKKKWSKEEREAFHARLDATDRKLRELVAKGEAKLAAQQQREDRG